MLPRSATMRSTKGLVSGRERSAYGRRAMRIPIWECDGQDCKDYISVARACRDGWRAGSGSEPARNTGRTGGSGIAAPNAGSLPYGAVLLQRVLRGGKRFWQGAPGSLRVIRLAG